MNTTQYRRKFLPVPGTDIVTWKWIGDAHEVLDVHLGFWGTIAECGQVSVRAERVLEKHTVAVPDPDTTFTFEMTPFRSDTPCASVVPPKAFDVAWSFTDGRHIHKRRTRYAVARRSRGGIFLDVDDFMSNGTPFRMLEFIFWDQRDCRSFQPPRSLVGHEVTDQEEYSDVAIANRRGFRWTREHPGEDPPAQGEPATSGDDDAPEGSRLIANHRTGEVPERARPHPHAVPTDDEGEPGLPEGRAQIEWVREQMESDERGGDAGGGSSYFDDLWRRDERRARDRRYHYGGPRDGAPIDEPDDDTGAADTGKRGPSAADDSGERPGT